MNRLNFLGLNANQAACLLLYVIAAVWILNYIVKRVWVKSVLIVIEVALLVAIGASMSRGGVVALVCAAVYVRFSRIGRGLRLNSTPAMARHQKIINWFSHSPLWRVALVLCNPGLWERSTPAYLAQDASIGNRFELWKGAVKLIASAPVSGWGYHNTGASYMNWFQSVDDHTYYNGLVNSFLQIGAAFGLPVLGGLLFVLILALMTSRHGLPARESRSDCPVRFSTARSESVPSPHGLAAHATAIRLLCSLWLLIWMLNSCFSSMLSSPMLMLPPLVAVIVALLYHPPRMAELVGSLMISLSLCLLLFLLGIRLAGNDSIAITRKKSGIVTVTNNKSKTGKTCVIHIDQGALGEEFGKGVRKFLTDSNFGRCVVVDSADYLTASVEKSWPADLIILSGNTVGQVVIIDSAAKYILLNPEFLPADMPGEAIQAIVYPEINCSHCLEPDADALDKLRKKIRVIPYNECFETAWTKYADQ